MLLIVPKVDLHLQMNSYHHQFLDVFFKFFTKIAEYGFFVCLLILLFYKMGAAIYMAACGLSSTIIVQIIKYIVKAPRPKSFFESINSFDLLPLVEGVELHHNYSFPSGHTCTFFLIFGGLSILITHFLYQRHKGLSYFIQFICFLLAIIGSYSRIYLSQHFAIDIFAGGIIGMICLTAFYPLFVFLSQNHPTLFNYKIHCFSNRRC